MSSSPKNASDWDQFFRSVAHHVKALASKQWPLEKDGSGHPDWVSIRRLFDAFPFPVDVLLLDTTGIESSVKEGNLAALIRYDVTRPNSLIIRNHGVIPLADLSHHTELVGSLVDLDDWGFESLRELRLRAVYPFPYYVDIVPFDPRVEPARYALGLLRHFDLHEEFSKQFSARREFNAEYDLQPDPVLEEADLLAISHVNVGFFSQDRATAIRQIQEDVSYIQLIPQVPEHPRRVFDWAKRLYIFGLFEYGFFTVSCHYAYLAIESAVYNRWNAAQPSPSILQHRADSITVPTAGGNNIRLICKEKGWRPADVKVNGRPYPLKVGTTIDQLRQDGVINAWQQRRLRDVWMKGRNIHSHLEFASITGPDLDTLERAAEVINLLFESVKP